jgi:hypothetical protein
MQINSDNFTLTAKQARSIGYILTSKTLGDAAKGTGVSERTLYTWLKIPEYRTALREAEKQTVENATRRLIAGQNAALDTLEALITKARNEGVRRASAMDWLNMVLKFRDMAEIDERLTALEQAVKNGK